MKQIANIPIHPFLLATFYILSLYHTNLEHHPFDVIFIPLICSSAFISLTFLFSWLLTRHVAAGSLISSATLLFLVVIPSFQDATDKQLPPDAPFYVLLLMLFFTAIFLRSRSSSPSHIFALNRTLNLLGICCVSVSSLMIAMSQLGLLYGRVTSSTTPAVREWAIPESSDSNNDAEQPHIYHIVLDGYARSDVLNRLYAFDNGSFLDQLRTLGFYVADNATANYCQTGLSMSSMLNCNYFEFPESLRSSNNRSFLKVLFSQASIPTFLRSCGYKLRVYDSGYFLTDSMLGAKILSTSDCVWNEFSLAFLRNTLLVLPRVARDRILSQTASKALHNQHRKRVLKSFHRLKHEAAKLEQPAYTFVHLLSPHPPFVFPDSQFLATQNQPYSVNDGSHLTSALPGGSAAYRNFYVNQLKAINQMVLATVTELISASNRPVVILLHSDHGPGSELNWNNIQKSDAEERLGILTAIYFSNENYSSLYSEISLVNVWRVVLNEYFCLRKLPLLDDKSFLSSWPRPFDFHSASLSSAL